MPNDLQRVLTQGTSGSSGAATNSDGTVGAVNSSNRSKVQTNPLIELLTERLTQQGKGISSSSSSNLQKSIDDAIASAQASGNLTNQGIESARQREIAFARGQASDTYTTALEGRTGYATQVAGLRTLTETTEKSIRDLDQRYREASLASDAATMKTVSDLRIKKLEFQQKQEENFYSTLLSTANLQQTQIGQMMQNDQFWAGQEEQQKQFAMQMAQSDFQFQKNLGIQYQEIGLKQQSLDLEKERNNISWAQYKLESSKLNKEKNTTSTLGMITERILGARKGGVDYNSVDPMADAGDMYAEIISKNPNFDMDQNEFNTVYMEARSLAMAAEISTPQPAIKKPSPFMNDVMSTKNYLSQSGVVQDVLKYHPLTAASYWALTGGTDKVKNYFTSPE